MLLHLIRAAVAQQRHGGSAAPCSGAAANGAGPGEERPASGNAAVPEAIQRLQLSDGLQHDQSTAGVGGIRTFVFERDDDFMDIRNFVAAMDRQCGLNLEVACCEDAHRHMFLDWERISRGDANCMI